jgi:hypothetical protein
LVGLQPLSECWPMLVFSILGMAFCRLALSAAKPNTQAAAMD